MVVNYGAARQRVVFYSPVTADDDLLLLEVADDTLSPHKKASSLRAH